MSDGLRQVTGLDYRLARIMRHSGCVSGPGLVDGLVKDAVEAEAHTGRFFLGVSGRKGSV